MSDDLTAARAALGLPGSVPPVVLTQEANAARIAALEAEVARLRAVEAAMLDHFPDCGRAAGYYALENDCTCGLYYRRQVINALLAEGA